MRLTIEFAVVVCTLAVLSSEATATRHTTHACSEQGAACSGMNFVKDQVLLQLGAASVSKHRGDEASSCRAPVPQRRRETTTTCRRRHSAQGKSDSDKPWDQWKCNEAADRMECDTSIADKLVGFPSSGLKKAGGQWCEVDIPPATWKLKSCPQNGTDSVKVLTYNLYWWNLFQKHGGGGRSASRLIARTSKSESYDMMAFQECSDTNRVLEDARESGLNGDFQMLDGGRGISIAYLASKWKLLAHDSVDVGEDSKDQYYGRRSAMWARLQNREGKIVFFMNHHGPLKVSQGGGCTGSATALNIMRVIGENAHTDDVIILVGDFNARKWSSRIQELSRRLHRVFSGIAMRGVDHIFSNCKANVKGRILGKGDGRYKSDHDALSAVFRI